MKKRVIYIIYVLLVFCILSVTISSVYAWYTNAVKSSSFTIKSANVSSSVTLYRGIDNNQDGILEPEYGDLGIVNDEYYEYMSETSPTKEEEIQLSLDKICPTEVYTWRIIVKNEGDVDAYVSFTINEAAINNPILKYCSITIYDMDKTDETPVKEYIGIKSSEDIIFGNKEEDKVDRPYIDENGYHTPSKSYIIKLEFETEEDLQKNAPSLDISGYQEVQTSTRLSSNIFSLILSSDKPQSA